MNRFSRYIYALRTNIKIIQGLVFCALLWIDKTEEQKVLSFALYCKELLPLQQSVVGK